MYEFTKIYLVAVATIYGRIVVQKHHSCMSMRKLSTCGLLTKPYEMSYNSLDSHLTMYSFLNGAKHLSLIKDIKLLLNVLNIVPLEN